MVASLLPKPGGHMAASLLPKPGGHMAASLLPNLCILPTLWSTFDNNSIVSQNSGVPKSEKPPTLDLNRSNKWIQIWYFVQHRHIMPASAPPVWVIDHVFGWDTWGDNYMLHACIYKTSGKWEILFNALKVYSQNEKAQSQDYFVLDFW